MIITMYSNNHFESLLSDFIASKVKVQDEWGPLNDAPPPELVTDLCSFKVFGPEHDWNLDEHEENQDGLDLLDHYCEGVLMEER
jgi:hypothetical protein